MPGHIVVLSSFRVDGDSSAARAAGQAVAQILVVWVLVHVGPECRCTLLRPGAVQLLVRGGDVRLGSY